MDHRLVYNTSIHGQQFIVVHTRLSFYFNYLHSTINHVDPETTAGDQQVYEELSEEWTADKASIVTLLGPEVNAFNRLVARENLPAVVVPK